MAKHKIHIPENPSVHKIHYADSIYFKFDMDDNVLTLSDPTVFKEPLPLGPFPKGHKIGPFHPAKHKITVDFFYDGSEIRGMHTIEIGD